MFWFFFAFALTDKTTFSLCMCAYGSRVLDLYLSGFRWLHFSNIVSPTQFNRFSIHTSFIQYTNSFILLSIYLQLNGSNVRFIWSSMIHIGCFFLSLFFLTQAICSIFHSLSLFEALFLFSIALFYSLTSSLSFSRPFSLSLALSRFLSFSLALSRCLSLSLTVSYPLSPFLSPPRSFPQTLSKPPKIYSSQWL